MEELRKKIWEGKRIFVKLKSGTIYSGIVIYEDVSSHNLTFLTILDKFNAQVTFPFDEIAILREER